MPLLRSAARRASRKDEVSPLLVAEWLRRGRERRERRSDPSNSRHDQPDGTLEGDSNDELCRRSRTVRLDLFRGQGP
jgi:hypothetical protein